MIIFKTLKYAIILTLFNGLIACNSSSDNATSNDILTKVFDCVDSHVAGSRVICIGESHDLSDETIQDELLSKLSNSENGDTFIFPQGRYNLTRTIEFNGKNGLTGDLVSDLTFIGAGMTKTIFDVSQSTSDGFLINNTDRLLFEDFSVYESNNNAIKVTKSDQLIIRRVATVWENDYQPTNGAYGLYPVETSNILIEECFVQGSADAGIYVGQSNNIIVRNNLAVKNVAGIEIENSMNADVYDNTAIENTGGILVFDLPIGNGRYGSGVRVFNNIISSNNAPNFAKGCTQQQIESDNCFPGGVHIVPPGTGIIILATSDVEIFNNTISNHQTTAIAVTSYLLPDDKVADEPDIDVGGSVKNYSDIAKYAPEYLDGWSPLVKNISIHDNIISLDNNLYNPQGELIKEIILGYDVIGDQVPDILYDGLGEFLANTGAMSQIANGINQIAQGLDDNQFEIDHLQIANLEKFSAYENVDRVCVRNNGNINASSVYPTQLSDALFNNQGEPLPILSENNQSMNCQDFIPNALPAATATINGIIIGCGEDDTNSDYCIPEI